jgi:cell division protein FtsW (lipid II flippase)
MLFQKILKLVVMILPAICSGAYIAHASGVAFQSYLPNFAAVFLGALFFFFISIRAEFFYKNAFSISLVALFIIFLSLFSTGLESVHRWIALGPIFLNVSMALAPVMLYGITYSNGIKPLALSIILSSIYIFQPDAGQATAFAFSASIIFLLNNKLERTVRMAGTLFVMTSAAVAWTRPDPLLPVEHVERILHLAFNQGTIVFTISVVTILILFIPLLRACVENPTHRHPF